MKKCMAQLDNDLGRCHQYDSCMNGGEGMEKVRRVTRALMVNQGMRYLQGMDSMVFTTLKITNWQEGEAFTLLTHIHPRLMHNGVDTDPLQIKQDMLLLQRTLMLIAPSLALYLSQIGFEPEMYAVGWLVSAYSQILEH